MTKVLQMQIHAPSGARNPHIRTDVPRCSAVPANVVWSTSQPQPSPASSAANCSSRRGNVQNVSRPTVRCQETSQSTPTTTQVEATSTAAAYQGTLARP